MEEKRDLNRKQKKELRERLSTRQLMGIAQLTDHGVKTAKGELVFFMLRPDNLSVLSPEGVRGRVTALTNLLRATPAVRLLALDSRESFQANQDFYHRRLEEEQLPAVRELLRRDAAHLDDIQASTASAREFALVYPVDKDSAADPRQTEKSLRDGGFHVRLADTQDIKRILMVYYQRDIVAASSISFAPPRAAGLTHSAAAPLPTQTASLGSRGDPWFSNFDGEEAVRHG